MRKNWLWYQMFRYPIVKTGLNIFFKKIIIEGREQIPKNKPVLFVPNHQNSFMDALLVVTDVWPFIYFLTRAQAFNPPLMAKFLRSLNMLPVYRVRDGLSSVTKNNAIFDECVQYMKRNDAILIFAEANHDLKRRVRPLSKGFTRIAFDAEVRENWNMDLHVIPVGLNYESHRNSRTSVKVVFGKPILMKKYEQIFKEDERKATNQLKADVAEGMKKTIMHVPNLDHYQLHNAVLVELEPDAAEYIDPDKANSKIPVVEELLTVELVETANNVMAISEKNDIPLSSMVESNESIFKSTILFPLRLFAGMNNFLPYQPARRILSKIKDHAFDASIKFILGLVLFPLYWALMCLILFFAGVPLWIVVSYFLLSLMTVPFFDGAKDVFDRRNNRIKLKELKSSSPEIFKSFVKGIETLNEFRSKVLQKYKDQIKN